MLEVLIYLGNMKSGRKELTQYFSQQTELIINPPTVDGALGTAVHD